MRITTIGMALLGGLVTASCAPDIGLGDTVRHNMALQIVDPDPEYSGVPIEGGSGVHSREAIKRYHKGEVKDPKPPRSATAFGESGTRQK